ALTKRLPVFVPVKLCPLNIGEPGTLEAGFAEEEPARFDDIDRDLQADTAADQGGRVLWDVGFEERESHSYFTVPESQHAGLAVLLAPRNMQVLCGIVPQIVEN